METVVASEWEWSRKAGKPGLPTPDNRDRSFTWPGHDGPSATVGCVSSGGSPVGQTGGKSVPKYHAGRGPYR